METIINSIINIFSSISSFPLGKKLIVLIISMSPVFELRGGIVAAAILNLNPFSSYLISVIGNIIPVPFILLFIGKLIKWFEISNIRILNKFALFLRKKVQKNKKTIEKYGYFGLILFVGIPLPGTGAWTGCLVSNLLGLDNKKAFPCVILGILMASIIMMLVSFGILKNVI